MICLWQEIKTVLCPATPAERLEKNLLRQWQAGRRQTALQLLPLSFLLRSQLATLAAIQPDEKASSDSPSTPQRVKRSVARLTQSANNFVVNRPLAWLSRRRCLQPLRVRLVNSRRRLTVWLLVRLVRLARWSLNRRRSFRGIRNS